MNNKYYHVQSFEGTKASILTQNHEDALNFYNDCKERGATVQYTVLTEKQADDYKKSIEKRAMEVMAGPVLTNTETAPQ